MDFTEKSITREKEGPFIRIKRPIHQEDIAVLTSNAPNIRIAKYMKQNPSRNSLVAQQIKNLALSLQPLRSLLWCGVFFWGGLPFFKKKIFRAAPTAYGNSQARG